MVNKAIILGHVGKDAETRMFASGDAVCSFSVATSEKWKDKTGEWKENTTWHRIQCFGKLAEVAQTHVKKGSQVYVEGKITTRSWKDKDGVEKFSTDIKADVLKLLGSKEAKEEVREEVKNGPPLFLGEMEDSVPF